MAVDAARQGKEMQVAYAAGIEGSLQAITPRLAGGDRADAIAMLASLIGTIVLARGVGGADPALSAEILEAGRKHLAEGPAKTTA